MSNSVNLFEIIGVAIRPIFRNVQHSRPRPSAFVNLRVGYTV